MDLSVRVQQLIEPSVGDLGFDIVRVQISGKEKPAMQIMVEHKGGPGDSPGDRPGDRHGMTVDDCATVSRAVSALLEVEDLIEGPYTLEVSSPGLDRPLVRIGDFERFQGYQARIEVSRSLDGRRRFKGRLLGIEGDNVRILVDGVEVDLPHPDIHRAKLLMTGDLIAAAKEN